MMFMIDGREVESVDIFRYLCTLWAVYWRRTVLLCYCATDPTI